jgi:SAM-dependent methyltransferase
MTAAGPLAALFAEATAPCADDGEIAWYRQHLPEETGLVLDVLCGYGRVLVPLCAAGRKVHGIDPSAAMLERCNARLAAAGLATTTLRQEPAQMNLPFRYVGAYVAGGALQAITDPVLAEASLARIRAHLVDPGVLLVDCRVPPTSQQRLAAPLVELRTATLADGTRIALRSETTWTPEARLARAQNRYAHRRAAQLVGEEHETLRSTWYAPADMIELVRAAGYRDVRVAPAPIAAPEDEAFAVIALA